MASRIFRYAKARLLRFQAEYPPVLIMGLRRGGSTMVADAVSANRGVWFADEPYAMFPGRPGYEEKVSRLFVPQHSHFFDLSDRELELFEAFSHNLLAATFRCMGTARRTLPGLRSNRTSLKILNAPWMLPWFVDQTNAQIISLLRHPGAQASSVLRQGWGFPLEAYLARTNSMDRIFGAEKTVVARNLWRNGTQWQRAILDWVVTSHPLRTTKNTNVFRVSYEQIVKTPETFVDDILVKKCGLTDRKEMIDSIARPSGSSMLSTPAATRSIAERNLDKMLNGWRDGCSSENLEKGQEILDMFNVKGYSFFE